MPNTLPAPQGISEAVHYNVPDIPLYIRRGRLSLFPEYRVICHWHADLEFIRVYGGHMFYYINGRHLLLHPGDGLLVNARQMHYGYGRPGQDCEFLCVLIDPTLLAGSEVLYNKFYRYILERPDLSCRQFVRGDPLLPVFRQALDAVWAAKAAAAPGYELRAVGQLQTLWGEMLGAGHTEPAGELGSADELALLRAMLGFISAHYDEPLTLEAVAAAGGICRSRCCALFKRYLQQSPIDFLNHYRLESARRLLADTDDKVTEIALACGFNTPSYFAKLFVRSYRCTPLQYRRTAQALPPGAIVPPEKAAPR